MSSISQQKKQKKSASAAATVRSASHPARWGKNNNHLYHTTPLTARQILHGAAAWISFLGMLGVMGGIERGSISFGTGCIWLAALTIGFLWGCGPWMKG